MANCMICNAEFDPTSGTSKHFCPTHCAPQPQKKTADDVEQLSRWQVGVFLCILSSVLAVLMLLISGHFLLAFVCFIAAPIVIAIITPKNLGEAAHRSALKPAMICPHCQKQGCVATYRIKRKTGISGAKATGAILTGEISIIATGLSRKEAATQAHRSNCGADWMF
jgi:hypothetical protein